MLFTEQTYIYGKKPWDIRDLGNEGLSTILKDASFHGYSYLTPQYLYLDIANQRA